MPLPATEIDQDYAPNGHRVISQTSVDAGTFDGILSVQKWLTDNYGQIVSTTHDLKTASASAWSGGSAGQDKRVDFVFNPDGTIRRYDRYSSLTNSASDLRGESIYTYEAPGGGLSELKHAREFGTIAQYLHQYTTVADQTGGYFPPTGKLKHQQISLYDENGVIDTEETNYKYDDLSQLSEITRTINGTTSTVDMSFDAGGNRDSVEYKFSAPNRLSEDSGYTYRYNNEGQLIERTAKLNSWVTDIQSTLDGYQVLNTSSDYNVDVSTTGGAHGTPSKLQDVYTGTHFDIEQRLTIPEEGHFDIWFTYGALVDGIEVPYEIKVDGHVEVAGTVDFAASPHDVTVDGVSWTNLGRIHFLKNPAYPNAIEQVEVILQKSAAHGTGTVAWDTVMVTPSFPFTEFEWGNQGHLIRQTAHLASANSDTVSTVEFAYDGIGRPIVRHETVQRITGSVVSTRLESYASDGNSISVQFDDIGKVTRSFLNDPLGSTPLAIDQAGPNGNRTAWYFADTSGDARTIVVEDGGTQVIHRQFSHTGVIERTVGDDENAILTAVPVYWHGMRLDASQSFYLTSSGIIYDQNTGRSLQDRGGSNGYVMFGNAPTIATSSPDWDALAGPNADGYSNHINRFLGEEGFVRGFGAVQAVLGGVQIYAGGFGVATGWLALPGAAAFLNGVDDVQAGLRTLWSGNIASSLKYDAAIALGASENLATGIDIGIGMIGGGLDDFGRSLLRNGYKEGATAAVKNSALHAARFMSVEAGATVAAGAYGYYSNGNSWDAAVRYGAFGSVTGGLAAHRFVKCFTAGTPVAVGLTHGPYDARPVVAAVEDESRSGVWLIAGVATLSSVQIISGERPPRRRKRGTWPRLGRGPDSTELDAIDARYHDVDFEDVCTELQLGRQYASSTPFPVGAIRKGSSMTAAETDTTAEPRERTAVEPSQPSESKSGFRRMLIGLMMLLAGACFWNALPDIVSRDASAVVSATAVADTPAKTPPTITTRPIEMLKPGQRALARNPEVSHAERAAYVEPDFRTWLLLSLEMSKPDGSMLRIEMLRSQQWFAEQVRYVVAEAPQSDSTEHSFSPDAGEGDRRPDEGPTTNARLAAFHAPLVPLSPLHPVYRDIAEVAEGAQDAGAELIGLTVEMDLPELGLTGDAIVTDIRTSPQIEPRVSKDDPRRVITATFHHTSGDVIDLVV
ncbi:MAG: hypothetical protein RIK87_15845, partial [Fuerstiella sp.]